MKNNFPQISEEVPHESTEIIFQSTLTLLSEWHIFPHKFGKFQKQKQVVSPIAFQCLDFLIPHDFTSIFPERTDAGQTSLSQSSGEFSWKISISKTVTGKCY